MSPGRRCPAPLVSVPADDVLAIAELLIALSEVCEHDPDTVQCALGRYGDRFDALQLPAQADHLVRVLAWASARVKVTGQVR